MKYHHNITGQKVTHKILHRISLNAAIINRHIYQSRITSAPPRTYHHESNSQMIGNSSTKNTKMVHNNE